MIWRVARVSYLLVLLLWGEALAQDGKGMLLQAVREMIQNQYIVSLRLTSASVGHIHFQNNFGFEYV